MNKIIIVNNGDLPLPAVKGGAVETLIDLLVNENEKYGDFQFEIYSNYDEKAIKESQKFKNSKFIYVKQNGIVAKIKRFLIRIVNFIALRTGGYFHSFLVSKAIVRNVYRSPEQYSAILLEGTSLDAYYLSKKTHLPIFQRVHNIPGRGLKQFDTDSAKATCAYLGISKFICNNVVEHEGKYCKNIELLYNSVDFELFRKEFNKNDKKDLRSKLGFDNDDFIVMFSGRLREFKGIGKLLEAFIELREQKSIKLMMVGSAYFSSNERTDFEKSLDPLIKALGPQVKFTGYVPYKEMYKYYMLADLCVFPSIWQEPFALTCLEALVCGRAVIVTQSGGLVEVVNEKCAITVPINDDLSNNLAKQILFLYNNPWKIREMESEAIKRADFFSPDKQYRDFSRIIHKYCD